MIVPETDAHRRVGGAIHPVVRVERKQLLHFLAGANVLVAFQENDGVFVAGLAMLRGQLQHASEQDLGIVRHVEVQADLGEEAHALDVVPMGEQVLAYRLLGVENLPVGVHVEGRDDRGRQGGEVLRLRIGVGSLCFAAL